MSSHHLLPLFPERVGLNRTLDITRFPIDSHRMNFTPKYVTNDSGERTEVILPIDTYEALMEDLSDLASIADRRSEPTIPHSQFLEELKADGILQH